MKKMMMAMLVMLLLSGCDAVISQKEGQTSADTAYSLSDSTYIELGDQDVVIDKAGTYVLSGTLDGASVIVEVSNNDKVKLVLAGVQINADDFAGIYIREADQVQIILEEGTDSCICDAREYVQIDDNDVDALIYSKADLLIGGSGSLRLESALHHGIVSKDDLVISSGTFTIDVAGRGISGKDCLQIEDGDFTITSIKDALRSDNDEDEGRGYVQISGGSFTIVSSADGIYGCSLVQIDGGDFTIKTLGNSDDTSRKAIKSAGDIKISSGTFRIGSADDGIHAESDLIISGGEFTIDSTDDALHGEELVQIDGGTFAIIAHEGIEATYVLINDGDITIDASDDGINAGQKSDSYTATVEINGGSLAITMAQGDTDAIDSNGYIYVNGGTIEITGQSAFDYDLGAEKNGGTIIVNGTQVDQISTQMAGGMNAMPGGNHR